MSGDDYGFEESSHITHHGTGGRAHGYGKQP